MRGLGVAAAFRARLRARRVWVLAVTSAVLTAVAVLGGVSPEAAAAAGPLGFLGGILSFVALVGGWVGPELRSGAALFWIQTPHPPLLLYGVRFAGVAGLATLVACALPGAAALILLALGHPDVAADMLMSLPGLGLYLALLAALVWGTGGWAVRGDTWAGPALGAALLALELVVHLQPDALGPLLAPADLLGLPLDDLGPASAFLSGTHPDPGPLARLLPWLGAWIALGAAGVHVTARRAAVDDRAS